MGRIRDEETGVRLDESTFAPLGSLVSPLPLEDDALIWEFDLGGHNTVHRISLERAGGFPRTSFTSGGVLRPSL